MASSHVKSVSGVRQRDVREVPRSRARGQGRALWQSQSGGGGGGSSGRATGGSSMRRAPDGAVCALALALALACARPAGPAFSGYSLPQDYDRSQSPAAFTKAGPPLEVKLRARVVDVLTINEFQSDLSVDMVLYRRWLEPRVSLQQPLEPGRYYALEPRDSALLWTPDLYVMGVRHFSSRDDEMAVRHLRLLYGGYLEHIIRATIVMKCSFDFRPYPFDVQECNMDFMSPLQTTEEQRLSWYDEARPVGFYGRPQAASQLLPQYEVVLTHCPAAFTTPHVSGNVSSLRLWLLLRRDVRAPLLELYLPTGLFVCMSWGSFLVRPAMVPGRMVLLVTTLLSLVTLFESSR
ncbi:gamma-aminobutyric acid receptor subunit pi-like [Schistocerca gregaria]|uniref:gamma-aminobutyric acid receptor subunit pi-like n=1 Tax=Schistocerca gregaria TaxID=7010 RepID=UPI00211EFFF8|nr:gamma-aminobutyric acid receptor subunit pi-like [Schistocerca gregaria]